MGGVDVWDSDSYAFASDVLARLRSLLCRPGAFRLGCMLLRSCPKSLQPWTLAAWHRRHISTSDCDVGAPSQMRKEVLCGFDALLNAQILDAYELVPCVEGSPKTAHLPEPLRRKIKWAPHPSLHRANRTAVVGVYEQIPIGWVYEYLTTNGNGQRVPSTGRCVFNPKGHKNRDANPSLSLWNEKGLYKCYTCGVSGNRYKLARFLLNRQLCKEGRKATADDLSQLGHEMLEAYNDHAASRGGDCSNSEWGSIDVQAAYRWLSENLPAASTAPNNEWFAAHALSLDSADSMAVLYVRRRSDR
jgi:hypothetical protein